MNEPVEHVPVAIGTKIVEYSKVDAGLAELRGRLANVVYDVTTPAGMAMARRDRRECVRLRTDLEGLRKTLKADVLERGRLIDGEAGKIKSAIEEMEKPIDEQIVAEENRIAAERAAREQAERDRVNNIHSKIFAISTMASQMVGKSVLEITAGILSLQEDKLEWAAEFENTAAQAKHDTLQILRDMHTARAHVEEQQAEARRREEEQRREREQEHARLEAQRKEQEAERERIAAEERAARERREREDREAKERRDAADREAAAKRAAAQKEQDERDAVLRKERERQEAEQREIERQKNELLDGAEMLVKFVERFGKRKEFSTVVRAIKDYLDKHLRVLE